ncbi:alpha/beta hydrolase-fold protein [Zobellia nedashkovskayae]
MVSKNQLIAYNRKLHEQLEEHEIPHVYEEFNGAHEWTYWSEHIKDTLRFFASHS